MELISVKNVAWEVHHQAIQHIRDSVFIQEQKVDRTEEYDGLDELSTTHHFAAFNLNEELIGYCRLLADGKIGRMAVIQEQREKGIGHALLREAVFYALKSQVNPSIYLHAQVQALGFYLQAGFVEDGERFQEAGIEHVQMKFRSDKTANIEALFADNICRFNETEDIHCHLPLLTSCTSRHIDILSDHLAHPIFTEKYFVETLSFIARKSRYSRIRILLRDSKKLHGVSHPLVTLAQRLSSAIEIRALTEETNKPDIAYLLSDEKRMVYFNNEAEHIGFANYRAGPEAENLSEDFESLWQRQAKIDRNLQRLQL